MTNTTVVFDLGNVLISWDRRLLFSQLIDDKDELEYVLDNVMTLDANQDLDRGKSLAEVAATIAAEHPEYAWVADTFADRWVETLGPVIQGTVDLLHELDAAGVRLLALSNWGRDTFAKIEDNYPFFEAFEGMVISGREGVIKPDPAIFHLLCRRYNLQPADALFIDDSEANIDAAIALGFDTVLFSSPEHLREELVRRELIPSPNDSR